MCASLLSRWPAAPPSRTAAGPPSSSARAALPSYRTVTTTASLSRAAAGLPGSSVRRVLFTVGTAVGARRPLQHGRHRLAVHASVGDEYFVTDDRPIILFDGQCNLCNGGVNFMLDWDRQGTYRMAALQSPAGRRLLQRSGRSPDDLSSIVLVEKGPGEHYVRSEAVLRIAAGLGLPLPLVAGALMPLPLPFRDTVYDQVANNRYFLFGSSQSCRLSDPSYETRFVTE